MNVLSTRTVIDSKAERQIPEVYDMDFDGYGKLWVTLIY